MINNNKRYVVVVVGPTGAGKSQFCNFVRRDKSNSINKVSESINSCTQEPFSNNFERQSTNYEFIDTAGNSDSSGNDITNLDKLVTNLKEKGRIDYILLLLKFGEKVTKETRQYIETLGKIFTPGEFFNHLAVFFTKFPIKPSKKEERIKNQTKEEINKVIKEAFIIKQFEKIPDVKVYFVDTEVDEDTGEYEEKFQETIDIMLENMKIEVERIGGIDTKNINITGEKANERLQEQKEQLKLLKEMFEKEKQKREEEEQEKLRLKNEIEKEKKDAEMRIKKEKELKELNERINQERKRLEELDRINRRKAEEYNRKKQIIEEEARKKGIQIEHLDNIIDECGTIANKSVKGIGVGSLLTFGICGLEYAGIICFPNIIAGLVMLSGEIIGGLSTITLAGSGVVAAGTKIKKEINK